MKFQKAILIIILFTVAIYDIAFAADEDTDTQTSVVTLTIPHVCQLTITQSDSSKTLGVDGDAESAFNAGYIDLEPGRPTLRVSANKTWKLTAKSSGFLANGDYVKSAGDLQLKDTGPLHVTNGFSDYKSLSVQDQEIASFTGGVKNESHPCQYRILLDYSKDIPGTYEATVTYTLATDAS
jgi:hypothetical protein